MMTGLVTLLLLVVGFSFATVVDETTEVSAECPLFMACEDEAEAYLSETIVPGFHLLCINFQTPSKLQITAWRNGMDDKITFYSDKTWASFHAALTNELDLDSIGPHPPAKYDWQMFTPDGEVLAHYGGSQVKFVFKGGRFIFPGVRVGHKQTVTNIRDLGSITLTTASMQPLVDFFLLFNFPQSECKIIVEAAAPTMYESPVSHHDADIGRPATDWRTSTQTWLNSENVPALRNVEGRVSDLVKLPVVNQETLQVLRYKLTQFYDAHHDYFNPALYTKSNLLPGLEGGRNNRLVTVFFYLSDVEEGGETIFPRFGNYRGEVNFKSCEKGLKIQPRRGKVAIFYSMLPNGQFDDNSLHGACPVIKGLKWAANKWVWTQPKR